MEIINKLFDKEYPFTTIENKRKIVRGIILNNKNQVAILKIERDDIFGKSNYFETPGGGLEDNESLVDGLKREIDEELGYSIEDVKEIGIVEDYYNLLKRKNINHYFLARVKEKTHIHHESFGDQYIKDILWVSIEKAIEMYENTLNYGISKLVKDRELPVLKIVKEYLGGN